MWSTPQSVGPGADDKGVEQLVLHRLVARIDRAHAMVDLVHVLCKGHAKKASHGLVLIVTQLGTNLLLLLGDDIRAENAIDELQKRRHSLIPFRAPDDEWGSRLQLDLVDICANLHIVGG